MKVAIVYESSTGNTEQMASAVCSGAKEQENEVLMCKAGDASIEDVLRCDIIFLGSPAMGDEVLDDSMEDFFSQIENSIKGKKIGLFGSYDWGDGQWMRLWEERVRTAGADLINGAGLTAHLEPDTESLKACSLLGKMGNI